MALGCRLWRCVSGKCNNCRLLDALQQKRCGWKMMREMLWPSRRKESIIWLAPLAFALRRTVLSTHFSPTRRRIWKHAGELCVPWYGLWGWDRDRGARPLVEGWRPTCQQEVKDECLGGLLEVQQLAAADDAELVEVAPEQEVWRRIHQLWNASRGGWQDEIHCQVAELSGVVGPLGKPWRSVWFGQRESSLQGTGHRALQLPSRCTQTEHSSWARVLKGDKHQWVKRRQGVRCVRCDKECNASGGLAGPAANEGRHLPCSHLAGQRCGRRRLQAHTSSSWISVQKNALGAITGLAGPLQPQTWEEGLRVTKIHTSELEPKPRTPRMHYKEGSIVELFFC